MCDDDDDDDGMPDLITIYSRFIIIIIMDAGNIRSFKAPHLKPMYSEMETNLHAKKKKIFFSLVSCWAVYAFT